MSAIVPFTSAQPARPGQGVLGAISGAAAATGVDFTYLIRTAQRESSLDPAASASTSTATGLFQFVDQTWLQTMKEDGPALGLGAYADQIDRLPSGRYAVANDDARRTILGLRRDPEVSSLMAAAFTRRNNEALSRDLGRSPTAGELYIAHFMGSAGASQFIRLAADQPDAAAADQFPVQAKANRAIFFDRGGQALPAAAVYDKLVRGYAPDDGITGEIAPVDVADASDALLPSNPARWLAIPAHNAYAIEPMSLSQGLDRRSVGRPVADTVDSAWSALGPARRAARPAEGLERPAAVVVAQPAALAAQAQPASTTSAPSFFESFFATLFSVQPNSPLAGG